MTFFSQDECALNASTETKMPQRVDRFSSAYDNIGFTTNTKKTAVLHQSAPKIRMCPKPSLLKRKPLGPLTNPRTLAAYFPDL